MTADKCNAVIVGAELLEPGMHLNAVGSDCRGKTELSADMLRAASVLVEFEPQARIEGELQQMPASFAVTELWRVLQGRAPGRRTAAEITLFDSVGFALEDFSALRRMAALAQGLGLGKELDLIPTLPDPRDRFSQLGSQGPLLRAA